MARGWGWGRKSPAPYNNPNPDPDPDPNPDPNPNPNPNQVSAQRGGLASPSRHGAHGLAPRSSLFAAATREGTEHTLYRLLTLSNSLAGLEVDPGPSPSPDTGPDPDPNPNPHP